MENKKICRRGRKILRKQGLNALLTGLNWKAEDSEIIQELHPDYYEEFQVGLHALDFFKAMKLFVSLEKEEVLFSSISNETWHARIMRSSDIFDMLPDSKVVEILETVSGREYMLFHCRSRNMQCKIMRLLNAEQLDRLICFEEGLQDIVEFLSWMYNEAPVRGSEWEVENSHIFSQKVANASPELIAKILTISTAEVGKNLFPFVYEDKRYTLGADKRFEVCQEISSEALFTVLEKTNFFLLSEHPSEDLFLLIYEQLPDEEKGEFVNRMLEESKSLRKNMDITFIITYYCRLCRTEKKEFIRKIFSELVLQEIEHFYHQLSDGEKLDMYESLYEDDQQVIRKILTCKKTPEKIDKYILSKDVTQ